MSDEPYSRYYGYYMRLHNALYGEAPVGEKLRLIAFAASELEKQDPDNPNQNEVYDLLSMLQYGDAATYRPLVEPYLHFHDYVLAEVALQVLCNFYNLTEQYIDNLVHFMGGVSWDPYDDLQSKAAYIAAHYLKDHTEPRLLQELINLVENGQQEGVHVQRDVAYTALVDAFGIKRDLTRHLRYEQADPSIIQAAKERLQHEHEQEQV